MMVRRSTQHAVSRSPTAAFKNTQKALSAALELPELKDSSPEEWDMDQVTVWMHAMGFSNVAENFKGICSDQGMTKGLGRTGHCTQTCLLSLPFPLVFSY